MKVQELFEEKTEMNALMNAFNSDKTNAKYVATLSKNEKYGSSISISKKDPASGQTMNSRTKESLKNKVEAAAEKLGMKIAVSLNGYGHDYINVHDKVAYDKNAAEVKAQLKAIGINF